MVVSLPCNNKTLFRTPSRRITSKQVTSRLLKRNNQSTIFQMYFNSQATRTSRTSSKTVELQIIVHLPLVKTKTLYSSRLPHSNHLLLLRFKILSSNQISFSPNQVLARQMYPIPLVSQVMGNQCRQTRIRILASQWVSV
jgi:hypothetical protein